jgi:hypothetical protein
MKKNLVLFISLLSSIVLHAGVVAKVGTQDVAVGTVPYRATLPLSLVLDGGSTVSSFVLTLTYDPTKLSFNEGASSKAGSLATEPTAYLTDADAGTISYIYFYIPAPVTIGTTEVIADLVFDVLTTDTGPIPVEILASASANSVDLDGIENGAVDVKKLFNAGDVTMPAIDEDAGWTAVDFTGKFTDVNSDPVPADVTAVGTATHGETMLEDDGTVYYRPNRNFNGIDTFTYTASYGTPPTYTYTDTGTITVTVNAVNDIPELRTTAITTANEWLAYTENQIPTAVNLFSAVEIIDPDFSDAAPQADFNGAKFYAIIDQNAQGTDTLGYPLYSASRIGGITLDGSTVRYTGAAVGTFAELPEGNGFVVTLSSDTRAENLSDIVTALVTDLQYSNTSDALSEAERLVRVFLDDAPTDHTLSHHLFEASVAFVMEEDIDAPGESGFVSVELSTDSSVRTVTLLGDGTEVVTMDQYGNLTGNHTDGEAWYYFDRPGTDPGLAEWDLELSFATWDNILTAFPDGTNVTVRLTYWDGSTSDLDIAISGLPNTSPDLPTATIAANGNDIDFSWAANTGDAAAIGLFAEIEGSQISELSEDEFETYKDGGTTWGATSHSFMGLPAGEYWAEIYAGNILVDGNVSGVPVESVWAGASHKVVVVGNTFEASGSIGDNTFDSQDAADLRVDVSIVDGSSMWQYYGSVETEFTGNGPWDYSINLSADAIDPDTGTHDHYFVQAYVDSNHNGIADVGEFSGTTTTDITGTGDFDIVLTQQERSWTRTYQVLGLASLYGIAVNDPPINTVQPSIAGTLQYGGTATAVNGDWDDSKDYEGTAPAITEFAYQWYLADDGTGANFSPIAGQTASTLSLIGDYVDSFIAVKVTATDAGVGILAVERATAEASALSAWNAVTKADQTITFAAPAAKTYGDVPFSLGATASSGLTVTYESSDTGVATVDGAGEVTIKGAGSTTITAKQAGNGNYNAAADVERTLTVGKKTLTATADDKSRAYKEANPAFTISYDGFVTGDDQDGIDSKPTAGTAATIASPVGEYDITVNNDGSDDNYTLVGVTGTLTITKADQTITFAAPAAKTYGDVPFSLGATASSDLAVSYESSDTTVATVDGTGEVTIQGAGSTTLTAKQAGDGNYNAAADVQRTLTVNQKALTITVKDASRSYFELNDDIAYDVTYSGLVAADEAGLDALLSYSTDATDKTTTASPVGSGYYTRVAVSNTATSPASNYDISYGVDGTLTITNNAPTRNAANSDTVPKLVVSGQPNPNLPFDLAAFFDDADKNLGDVLQFSDLTRVSGFTDGATIQFATGRADATSKVVFDPGTMVQGEGEAIELTFTVKVTDSADPAAVLSGTGDGVATIYLSLIDNQAPEVTAVSPDDEAGGVDIDDVEEVTVDEITIGGGGEIIPTVITVSLTATDEGHQPQDDGIATIVFEYSWNGTDWTPLATENFTPSETGEASANSAPLTLDDQENTISAAEGSKDLTVRATITDGAGVSAVKTWVYTVSNVNLQPTLDDIDDVAVKEDNKGEQTLQVLLTGVTNGGEAGDPGIQGDSTSRTPAGGTISAVSSSDLVTISSVVAYDPPRGVPTDQFLLTYALKPDGNGTATITVTVDDGTGAGNATIQKTFDIVVDPVNDAPSFTPGATVTVDEDSGPYSAGWATSISAGPADEITQTLTFNLTGNTNPGLFSTAPAIAANGTLTFTPAEDANGSAEVTVSLSDNGGTADNGDDTSDSVQLTINVTARNDVPTFTAGTSPVTVNEDSVLYSATWATDVSAGPADESAQELTFLLSEVAPSRVDTLFETAPSISAAGVLTFKPALNAFGSRTYEVRLQDNGSAEDPARGANHGNTSASSYLTITVTSVNDNPEITTDPLTFDIDEDAATGDLVGTMAASDVESDTLTWSIESNADFEINASSGEIRVKAGASLDYETATSYSLDVTVTDNGTPNESATVAVTIDVNDINEPPVAVADYATAKQDETIIVAVLENDTDPEHDTLDFTTVTITTPASSGTATSVGDGTVEYVPLTGFTGTATFGYTVEDEFGHVSNEATVTVVVGSPPWYPLFSVPSGLDGRSVVSFVKVRIQNEGAGTELTAVLPIDSEEPDLMFRPEDYITGEGDASEGLLPGTYTPFFSYWNENTVDFGAESPGESFSVSYEEPEQPVGLANVRTPANTPQVAVVAGGAEFSLRLAVAQGYVLEVFAAGTGTLVQSVERPLTRPDIAESFPVGIGVDGMFVPLAVGTYDWRVRAYNPLVPLGAQTRGEDWFEGPSFAVTQAAPAGAPAVTTLEAPGTDIVYNPNPVSGKASLDFFWDAVPGATSYYVYVGLNQGAAVVNNRLVTGTSLLGVSLAPGTYRWSVMAVNAFGRSAWATPRLFTVNPAPGLATVSGTYFEGSITFDWVGIQPVAVEMYVMDEGTYAAWMVTGLDPEAAYTPSGTMLLPGHTYSYRTRSVDANGTRGAWSAWRGYLVPEVGDEVVVAGTADTGTSGQVTFDWGWANMPVGAQVKIRIMRLSSYASGVWVDTTGATDFTLSGDAVAAPGETYYFQVRPLDADGEPLNGWSSWEQYTMPAEEN